jgi:MFS family permease
MSAAPAMKIRLPAFASRDFQIFWTTQLISLIGTWMQTTVQSYLAYRITGQPIYLGLIGVANTLPTLLFTLPGGVWVERLDKRKTVIAFQAVMMAQAFALALLTLAGVVTIWHIVALAFVLGAANSIEITARQAMMIEIVGKQGLPNAIGLNSTAFNVARVIGPALSAPLLLIFADNGEGWAFFLNGVSYLVVILGLLAIHPRAASMPEGRRPGHAAPASAFAQFREGQRYIRQNVLIGLVIVMAAVPGLFAFPVVQQVPAFARDVLAQPGDTDAVVAARNSALVTAQGIGALSAAVMLTLLSTFRRKGWLMTVGQFAFSAALLGIGLSRHFTLTLPILTLFGWGTVTSLATSNTIIQLVVPDELRGRVISTYLWALQGIAPFGSLLIGGMAQMWGAPLAALFSGLACLAIYAAINLKTPTARRFEG